MAETSSAGSQCDIFSRPRMSKAKDVTMSTNHSCQSVQVMTAWKHSHFLKLCSMLLYIWMDGSSRFEANFHPVVEVKSFGLSSEATRLSAITLMSIDDGG